MLSINCKNCGATNKFEEDSIPSFCSYCGAALPNMLPFIEEAIKISQERQRHEMEIEKLNKHIKKEKTKNFSNTLELILVIIVIGFFFYIFYKIFSL